MKPTAFSYTLVGDCYIPDVELPEDDDRPIGKEATEKHTVFQV